MHRDHVLAGHLKGTVSIAYWDYYTGEYFNLDRIFSPYFTPTELQKWQLLNYFISMADKK